MAKGDHTDLYMIFVDSAGKPVSGESRADLTSTDPTSKALRKGFDHNCVFEIERFTLSAEAPEPDEDEIRSSIMKQNQQTGKQAKGAPPPVVLLQPQVDQEVQNRLKTAKGPPVREINFTRTADSSSGAFMKTIAAGKGYQSATLIKRKSADIHTAAGKAAAGDVYLRIDFYTVLVTKVDWSDDNEEVKEDCSFICKKIFIQYRPQLPNGKLGAVVSGTWEWKQPSK